MGHPEKLAYVISGVVMTQAVLFPTLTPAKCVFIRSEFSSVFLVPGRGDDKEKLSLLGSTYAF